MKILLAIDTSRGSDAAVAETAARCWPEGTCVEVLSVLEPSHPWTVAEVVEGLARLAHDRVECAAKELQAHGLYASGLVLSGDPKAVIVDRAAETKADMVVLGSHAAGGFSRFLIGSVSRAVVRFAPCSVEIVRRLPDWRPPSPGLRILLATDGSEHSAAAARSIAMRPWPPQTEVRILSAVELSLTMLQAAFEPPFLDSAEMERVRTEAMKHAQEAIAEAGQILADGGRKTSEAISILIETPKQIIVDEARNWCADLIVVGSHGRRGMNRFLLGSVSEAVATHAECSVEVIRQT